MTSADDLFQQYRGQRVLLDTNLLLLYLVGTFERRRITVFKRTADFSMEEFDALAQLLRQFGSIVTTPHLLTEVNSLANSLPSHLKDLWSEHFARQIEGFVEVFENAATITRETCFNPFGLADAAIQNAAPETLILTEDFRLSGYLQSRGVAVLNFREVTAMM